jgi:hypothetical protein
MRFGWSQRDFQTSTTTLLRVLYSDSGATLHLDGAGGVEEQSVPLPGTLALLAAGAGGVLALRRRRRNEAVALAG